MYVFGITKSNHKRRKKANACESCLMHNKNAHMVPLGVLRDNKSLSMFLWIQIHEIERRNYLTNWQTQNV